MSGNVYEWVADYFAPYTTEPHTTPYNLTRINSSRQVIKRGGSFWYNDAYRYTCTYRYAYYEEVTDESIGFRLALKKVIRICRPNKQLVQNNAITKSITGKSLNIYYRLGYLIVIRIV